MWLAVAVIILGVVASAASAQSIHQQTAGWCSPGVADVKGHVTITCQGVDPNALARLNELLDKKDLELTKKIQEANEWAARYRDLSARLAAANDGSQLSQQAKALIQEGKFDEAGAVLDRLIARPTPPESLPEPRSARDGSDSPPIAAPAPALPPVFAPSSTSTIDRILESMQWGNIAFNAPRSMNIADSVQIHLVLSLENSIEDLAKAITAAGEKEGAHVRVSDRMEARLSGQGFQITAITSKEQAITSRGITEWRWEVKAMASGRQDLHLTLTALFDVDGDHTRRAIRTLDKTIEVQVTWRQQALGFMNNNWQWLWAAILFPLAGVLWRMWKGRT